jgi:hypothetical protein
MEPIHLLIRIRPQEHAALSLSAYPEVLRVTRL